MKKDLPKDGELISLCPKNGMRSRSNQNLLVVSIMLAVFIIFFVHLFLFPLYTNLPNKENKKTVRDYEQSLCKSNLRPLKVPYLWQHYCPKDGIVTVAQGGRLGNQMWEYASAWAVARRTGLEPFVPRCIRNVLDEVFEGLHIPPLAYVSQCPANWRDATRSPEAWTHTGQSIVLPRFTVLPELVLTWVDDIRREFRFRQKLIQTTRRVLATAAGHLSHTNTFVGVHVRRTDYKDYLWRTERVPLADKSYFLSAMKYYREKYGPGVVFLVVSDDPAWCRRHLEQGNKDVLVVSKEGSGNPGQDLAIMAHCNHSIIDYGTYGVWGAILAGGETILYNVTKQSSVRVSQLLPDWQILN